MAMLNVIDTQCGVRAEYIKVEGVTIEYDSIDNVTKVKVKYAVYLNELNRLAGKIPIYDDYEIIDVSIIGKEDLDIHNMIASGYRILKRTLLFSSATDLL